MSKSSHQARFITGSTTQHLIKMCLPMLLGMACSFSYVAFDLYFIGLLGSKELTAFSFCMPILDTMLGVGIGFGIAISSVSARLIGSGDTEELRHYLRNAFVFCILLSIVITTCGLVFMDKIFFALGATKETMPYIHQFMSVWFYGVILLFMNFMSFQALRAIGRPNETAFIQIASSFLNFFLDVVFIFGLKHGIRGAAEASIITRIISVSAAIYLMHKFHLIELDLKGFSPKKILESWKKMTHIMIPASLTNIMPSIATAWSVKLLAIYDQSAVAGYGISSKVQLLLLMPLLAMSGSIGPIVGQNAAANQPRRAHDTLKKCNIFSIAWGLLITVILYFFGSHIVSPFSKDTQITTVATEYLKVVPISYMAWGMLVVIIANFNALGRPFISTMLSLLRLIVIFFPLSYILIQHYDYFGIFYATNISTFAVAILAYILAEKHYHTLIRKAENPST